MAPPSRSNPSRKRKIDQSSESQDTEGGYISETPRKKAKSMSFYLSSHLVNIQKTLFFKHLLLFLFHETNTIPPTNFSLYLIDDINSIFLPVNAGHHLFHSSLVPTVLFIHILVHHFPNLPSSL